MIIALGFSTNQLLKLVTKFSSKKIGTLYVVVPKERVELAEIAVSEAKSFLSKSRIKYKIVEVNTKEGVGSICTELIKKIPNGEEAFIAGGMRIFSIAFFMLFLLGKIVKLYIYAEDTNNVIELDAEKFGFSNFVSSIDEYNVETAFKVSKEGVTKAAKSLGKTKGRISRKCEKLIELGLLIKEKKKYKLTEFGKLVCLLRGLIE